MGCLWKCDFALQLTERLRIMEVGTMGKLKLNRTYKDGLFRLVFKEKKDLLDLYNAIADRHYENPDDLIITTLDDAIYIGMKNDISFLVYDVLNLVEHQSSFNPNMPIRGLGYFSDVYQQYIEKNHLNIYGSKLIELPVPQYIVFYNGTTEEPDRVELKLSDAFAEVAGISPCLECTAIMLNINYGHNQEMMKRCKRLHDYSLFIKRVRENENAGLILEEAVDKAVTDCINDGILADILSKNRAEVFNLLIYEYDEKKQRKIEREEGKAEGKAESILVLLEDLGNVPEQLQTRILEETDMTILTKWLKEAARASSLEDFLKNIDTQ